MLKHNQWIRSILRTHKPKRHFYAMPVVDIVIPILYLSVILLIMPLRTQFEFDTDEGLNVMKAVLVNHGYALYQDIWNDQPPLFTLLLASVFKLFGSSILAARLLVLSFVGLLVYCFHRLVRLSIGLIPAIASTLLLVSSFAFMRLSSSVMIGLPALAFALLSLVLMVQYQGGYWPNIQPPTSPGNRPQQSSIWLYASGLCFAASLHTKLVTVVLLPLFILHVLTPKLLGINPHPFRGITAVLNGQLNALKPRPFWPTRAHQRDTLLWVLWLGVPFLLIGLGCHYFQFDQVLSTHLHSRQAIEEFQRRSLSFSYLLNQTLENDWGIYGLAGLGSAIALVGRHHRALIPGLWLLLVVLALVDHQPVWYHYSPLLMLPLCWLAAYGMLPLVRFLETIQKTTQKRRSLEPKHADSNRCMHRLVVGMSGCVALLSMIMIGVEGYRAIAAVETYRGNQAPSSQTELVQMIKKNSDSSQWLFTDTPLYGFYANVLVPPELVVFSKKRMLTEQLTPENILELMQVYSPRQVLFARFPREMTHQPSIARYLKREYRQVRGDTPPDVQYFVKTSPDE